MIPNNIEDDVLDTDVFEPVVEGENYLEVIKRLKEKECNTCNYCFEECDIDLEIQGRKYFVCNKPDCITYALLQVELNNDNE